MVKNLLCMSETIKPFSCPQLCFLLHEANLVDGCCYCLPEDGVTSPIIILYGDFNVSTNPVFQLIIFREMSLFIPGDVKDDLNKPNSKFTQLGKTFLSKWSTNLQKTFRH